MLVNLLRFVLRPRIQSALAKTTLCVCEKNVSCWAKRSLQVTPGRCGFELRELTGRQQVDPSSPNPCCSMLSCVFSLRLGILGCRGPTQVRLRFSSTHAAGPPSPALPAGQRYSPAQQAESAGSLLRPALPMLVWSASVSSLGSGVDFFQFCVSGSSAVRCINIRTALSPQRTDPPTVT